MQSRVRVGIVARLLYEPALRGWNRYTINLLAALTEQGVHPVLYSNRPIHRAYLSRLPAGSFTTRVREGLRLAIWEHGWLPAQCRADGVDVLHSPFNYGLPLYAPCPMVLTIHDAIDFVYYRRPRLTAGALRFAFDSWVARTRADRILTVSEHARGDIARHWRVPDAKLVVTHEAADPRFLAPVSQEARARVRARHALPGRYIFYVGGWEGRKNVGFLLRALADAGRHDVALVLAGGRRDQHAPLLALSRSLRLEERTHLLNWVDDEDLPALYAEALAFVYPSEYEGFGLQLCEAMAVGCPVLAARASCLPEILGDGGETFSLAGTAELASQIRRLAEDEPYRVELSARACARSRAFSWRRTAEQTAAVYRGLVP